MKYGCFSENGNEYIITNPQTPRAFDNFLWNDAVFSNVQQTGVGYMDYQVGDNEAVQLLTGIGRICDFDVFGRDNLMSRLIYIRDNETGEFWNVNWEPVRKEYESYQCIHGMGYTTIRTVVNGIAAEFKMFVPMGDDPVELWCLKTENISGKKRSLTIFVYNQFQFKFKWGFDSYGDMFYRSSWWNKELNAVVVNKNPYRKPHNYLTGFMTADRQIEAFDGTRDAFVGLYNSLKDPQAVLNGHCTNTPGSSDATIGVMQFNLEIANRDNEEISMILGAADNENNIGKIREKYLGKFDFYFNALTKDKEAIAGQNRIETPDKHMNTMLNYWVKQAALFGAAWCRWGWNGYRDIVQHGLGVSALKPERTREIILEALRYQYKSGLALRGWNPVDEKAYSDSALWLVFTLIAYLKETGDFALLNEVVPYYDEGSDSVLEHIEQALNFLENNKGSHGLILIKFGDWNDSLTAVGKEGRGESVWLSEAYAEAALQMASLAEKMQDDQKKNHYLDRRKKMIEAINKNAWDGNWYTRCFDDNGKPIGSHISKQGKIFFEAQTWALISGVADEERKETLIKACDKMLLKGMGYQLLTPTFTQIDDSIGRISSMQPGICENGTIYSHLNIWMILGLLRYHMADKAYDVFKRITPGYFNGEDDPKQKCPPYMYANCYYGPDHKNNRLQMEFTWITGSVAWYNTVLLNEMLGAKPEFNGLRIDPCIPSEWEKYKIERYFRGSVYHITVENPDNIQHGKVEVWVDGLKLDGNLIPVYSDKNTYEVRAVIKRNSER